MKPILLVLGTWLPTQTPFPAPEKVQATESTKCDVGTVLAVDEDSGIIRVDTPAGEVHYHVGLDVPMTTRSGQPPANLHALKEGMLLRIYFVVDQGAQVTELDIL